MKTRAFKDGEVLDCRYGHLWPLCLYAEGFVKISVSVNNPLLQQEVTFTWHKEKPDAT